MAIRRTEATRSRARGRVVKVSDALGLIQEAWRGGLESFELHANGSDIEECLREIERGGCTIAVPSPPSASRAPMPAGGVVALYGVWIVRADVAVPEVRIT
jgi:hypothetical protein